jgi:hypothetical protein
MLPALAASSGNSDRPFYQANKHPFIAIAGLPMAETAEVLHAGQTQWMVSLDISNWQFAESTDSESLTIDGETLTARLVWRRGLGKRFDLGLDVPLVNHAGGSFDSVIESWHDAWGFPQNGRDEELSNQLLYRYEDSSGETVSIDSHTAGLGDIRAKLGFSLLADDPQWLSLRATVKAPTGSADKLTGSGGWDASLGLHWRDGAGLQRAGLVYEVAAGGVLGSRGDVLAPRRRQFAAWANAMLAWHTASWLTLKTQLDTHSAFYRSELQALDSASVQLSLGASFSLTRTMALDVAVVEDLAEDTAPDVVFHLAWRFRPAGRH